MHCVLDQGGYFEHPLDCIYMQSFGLTVGQCLTRNFATR